MKKRIISILIACVMLFSALPVYADGIWQGYVTLTPGTDETEMGITWYAEVEGEGYVLYSKAEDIVDGTMPLDKAAKAPAVCEIADEGEGYYSYKATLTDLEPSTEYAYFLVNSSYAEKLRYFTTGDSDEFGFAMVSDVQIGAGGIAHDVEGWAKTLDIIENNEAFVGTDFILTTGDQVKDADNESQFEGFIEHEELSSFPVAPTIGNHDTNAPLHSLHFNSPNVSDEHGVTNAGGDSWFHYAQHQLH